MNRSMNRGFKSWVTRRRFCLMWSELTRTAGSPKHIMPLITSRPSKTERSMMNGSMRRTRTIGLPISGTARSTWKPIPYLSWIPRQWRRCPFPSNSASGRQWTSNASPPSTASPGRPTLAALGIFLIIGHNVALNIVCKVIGVALGLIIACTNAATTWLVYCEGLGLIYAAVTGFMGERKQL